MNQLQFDGTNICSKSISSVGKIVGTISTTSGAPNELWEAYIAQQSVSNIVIHICITVCQWHQLYVAYKQWLLSLYQYEIYEKVLWKGMVAIVAITELVSDISDAHSPLYGLLSTGRFGRNVTPTIWLR